MRTAPDERPSALPGLMSSLTPEEQALLAAVMEAREALLRLWPGGAGGSVDHLEVSFKADGSLLTRADGESHAILSKALAKHFPTVPIISEEDLDSHQGQHAECWIMDPLDGTRAYRDGTPDFALLISLWRDHAPRFSVIDFPAAGELVVAKDSAACFAHSGMPLPSYEAPGGQGPCVHGVYCEVPGLLPEEKKGLDWRAGELESTRAFLEVAKGVLAGAVVLQCGLKAWDLAAPAHVVAASGALITDEAGAPLRFTGSEMDVRYVVAARSPALHRLLLSKLTPSRASG